MRKKIFIICAVATTMICTPQVWALKNLKKTVAVFEFVNDSGYKSEHRLAEDFTTQLSDALVQSGRFNVLTRADLDVVFAEQDLAATNRMAKTSAAKKGKAIPAQYLVKGRITEFQENKSGGGTGFSIKGVTLGTKKSSAHVAVIVQIIDSTSGEIIDSQRVEGDVRSGGLSVGYKGDFDLSSSSFKKTPLGKALQLAIDRAVVYISERLDKEPWKGKVVTEKDGVIFINAGSKAGVKVGDTFRVYREGESLIDPDTGINLGADRTKLGTVEVFEVKEKFSKAEMDGNPDIEIMKGDVITQ